MKVLLDPQNNYLYSSFYVEGLRSLFGKDVLCYTSQPFRELKKGGDMRFIIQDGERQVKYSIHTDDSYHIHKENYAWCDVYGCVNANFSYYPKEQYPKLVSLAPSFGIRIDNKWQTLFQALYVFLMIPHTILSKREWNKYANQMVCNPYANIKHHFGRSYYRAWQNRLPLASYALDIESEDNYIFFLSTLWYNNVDNKNDENVNLRRAMFIRACRSVSTCNFEGGLLSNETSSNDLFADVLAHRKESFPSWIEKTKRSALVFNTPAFWDCHGWKLGEYLALGKCIISTKLCNNLPYPLEHGVNIHFVDESEQSMREAIEYILANPDYRHHLEQGAREYWNKYGTPEASLRLLGINA